MLNHVFYKIYLFVKLVPKGTVIQLKKVLRSRQAKKILIVIWPFLKKQELEVLWLKNSRREYQEVWSASTAPGSYHYKITQNEEGQN